MKETNDTKELENTIEAINKLAAEDAKSLLKIIYGFINTAVTGNGGDHVKLEVVDKIWNIYGRIPELYEIRKIKSDKKTE